MNENEAKKCPKCGGEMEEGRSLSAARAHFWEVLFSKKGDWYGDKVVPFYCRSCGYVELYKEMKERQGVKP
jgi:predicted nucleic-acid-binding Zn-ribbon protein